MEKRNQLQIALRVSWITVLANVFLSVFKLFAGIVGQSGAMLSDAVHSLSDVFSTFIVMAGVKIAAKESDANHQYGHERMECVAAIILAVLLALTGAGIGLAGLKNIISSDYAHLVVPGIVALGAAVISIVIKEIMFWYTRAAAQKIHSGALLADAWHHRSDALSSVGSFIGIFGARMGYPVLDSVASVVICGFILKAAYDIFIDAINKMTDHACDDETVAGLQKVIAAQEGVVAIDQIKTRLFGDKVYVDIEIQVDGKLTLNEAHGISQQVHDTVECYLPEIKHCMVHVNPAGQQHETAEKVCP